MITLDLRIPRRPGPAYIPRGESFGIQSVSNCKVAWERSRTLFFAPDSSTETKEDLTRAMEVVARYMYTSNGVPIDTDALTLGTHSGGPTYSHSGNNAQDIGHPNADLLILLESASCNLGPHQSDSARGGGISEARSILNSLYETLNQVIDPLATLGSSNDFSSLGGDGQALMARLSSAMAALEQDRDDTSFSVAQAELERARTFVLGGYAATADATPMYSALWPSFSNLIAESPAFR
ncbi:hypothetical protein QFC22_006312 [Naganishia vaughanmartiniae]|uniref:Uncharacterized protein n=1 Tax=Naganishia vaughanmartiniae TaxID=1424756 RepID=A0ACC2WL78_9TREE|nr:hypothetical protein QFC22_006312 [Naganishia vaughanmartiniae]